MPDETKGQDIVKETQSDLPAENKPADVNVSSDTEVGSLPEDVKERTKAEFEKLKKANQELKSQLEGKSKRQSVLDSLRPKDVIQPQAVAPIAGEYQNLGRKQVDEIVKDLVDSDGFVDVARLKETLRGANQLATNAQAEAQKARIIAQQASQRVAKYTETEEMRRVHKAFPTLDPESNDFDPAFFDLVRDRVVRQMTEGRQDVYQAAQEVSKTYTSEAKEAKAEQNAKAQATTTAKKQINASGSFSGNGSSSSHDDLVRGTMAGDRKSIYERMKQSGY